MDICSVTKIKFSVDDFSFGPLIWSNFNYLNKPCHEPFGSFVKYKDGRLFLVFRGSKSIVDFVVDAQYAPVLYTAPTPNPPSDINVETGWYKVHNGLLPDLRKQLQSYPGGGQKITVTGHSLGSTLATLAVPELIAHNMEVYHYNSASPMVGLQSFADYYNSLTIIGSSPGLLKETFRLVNLADKVPNVPNNLQSSPPKFLYVTVGTEISFKANYGKEEKTHDPCCSYAYALWNPESPCNNDYHRCAEVK
ncbi:lipase family protein [Psychroflexus torquis]|uniref:lipase family protein n=1 Tax=Psychroflexus torquis TaxID=57029 RepID=UPI0009FE0910